ncbi:hypothetical protein DSO57_1007122 [Entomophthora muscae]|uniref:Uncharacterized protein n=1 Tax=Entomophthora muscae TaxID=34485 RepID=A0ACC2SKT5_9FUNG|nr:hypothetical protein DSO57_1007122 [Entomophthora muscae]
MTRRPIWVPASSGVLSQRIISKIQVPLTFPSFFWPFLALSLSLSVYTLSKKTPLVISKAANTSELLLTSQFSCELENVGASFQVFALHNDSYSFLIWSTSPKLWTFISSSTILEDKNPSQILYLLDDLPGKAYGLFSTGEHLVCILTCDDVEFAVLIKASMTCQYDSSPTLALVEPEVLSPITSMPMTPEVAPRCTSWLVSGALLMVLNAYLPQLFHVGSFWSPV